MPKRHRQPSLVVDDASGRRLYAVWSRSGKRLVVTATTTRSLPYVHVGLDQDQVRTLIGLLAPTDEVDDAERVAIALDDPDEPSARLHAAWSPGHKRLTVTASDVQNQTPAEAHVVLGADDVTSFVRFMAAGPDAGSSNART